MAPPPPCHSDLVFPSQPSVSSLLAALRRSALSIHNRLASIRADAAFVARAAAALGDRPLVANERCGSWYVPPAPKAASAYFKSTDGHERAWKFSTRRLNLHLVDLAEARDGVIVVDSTRRGKRMPDALSTTVPVWCAVLNQVLLPDHPLAHALFLPPHLPPSTHAQVSALIPAFVASLRALHLDLPRRLSKPLRPLWVTPDSLLPETAGALFDDYRPVVCCTASRRVVAGCEADERGYVQGAADDAENWAHGLTPAVFWDHVDELLAAPDADLPDLISRLVAQHECRLRADAAGLSAEQQQQQQQRQVTPHISVCALPLGPPTAPNTCHVVLTDAPAPRDTWARAPTHMEAGLGRHKTASRNLRLALPDVCAFVGRFLESGAAKGSPGRVVVSCESGRDLSVGAALALSCYLFDDDGRLRARPDVAFTKALVKSRLGSIMAAYPEANPSRQTLQSVNSFLMDWRQDIHQDKEALIRRI